MEAEPAADGLDIEALRLRRAGHEHTVHSGGVEACGEHLDRGEYVDLAGLEGVVELPALAGWCLAGDVLGGHAAALELLGHRLSGGDRGHEADRHPARCKLEVGVCDL